jgi:hypothetical protein
VSGLRTKVTKGGGGDFEKPPAGNHPAVVVAVVDLLTQEREEKFEGETQVREKHEVFLCWELVTKKMAGMKHNHLLGNRYTFSLHERANLRKIVEGVVGPLKNSDEGFDLEDLLGKPCLLQVTHNDNGYPVIKTTSEVPEGMTVPPALRKPYMWENGKPLEDIPDWLPWIYGMSAADRIKESVEYRKESSSGGADEEDIPDAPAGGGPAKTGIPF